VFDSDLKDHRKYHQLLIMFKGPHLKSGGVGAGSCSKDSASRGGFSSSVSSFEEDETKIRTEGCTISNCSFLQNLRTR
jgi:hypothetical protein